jgi:hypothetical protein
MCLGARDIRSQARWVSEQLLRLYITYIGYLNDLWMFNITNIQWAWLSGNMTVNVPGIFGTKGVSSISNYPGSRFFHSMLFDPVQNNIYIFAGTGIAQPGPASSLCGYFN